ncbi:two component transcriptional regulator, LuxR family [Treponema bryantii]|uniref:Two component transcriptional regulator, LuxR family n=1 Tax=Treponema bryantii TaxID=163 RepID=A0A1H9APN1_9SPIR|nr:response regulator transcription factor [Treponema bryantii]SEP77878.1 two component transcriptional regulator, LuxR family [Treponema bryantii]
MKEVNFFVVEDHSLTNLGIRQFFAGKPEYKCCGFASDRDEALEKLAELAVKDKLPDILILDLNLGECSGLDILKVVKEKYTSTKVVVYSMYTNPGILSLALDNGALGFVSKDSMESELLKAVYEVVHGGSYVQQTLVTSLFTYRSLLDSLTKQEQNILKKIIERKENEQIASELNLTIRSVENYLSRIYSKTGCRGHEELVAKFG